MKFTKKVFYCLHGIKVSKLRATRVLSDADGISVQSIGAVLKIFSRQPTPFLFHQIIFTEFLPFPHDCVLV